MKILLSGLGFTSRSKPLSATHMFYAGDNRCFQPRGWVHQEIGYAMALNIPVLPGTRDMLPGEMIQRLRAVRISVELEDIKEKLPWEVFDNLFTMSYPKHVEPFAQG